MKLTLASRRWRRASAEAFFFAFFLASTPTLADPVKGEAKVTTDGGYARVLFRLDEPVDAQVRVTGAVMVVTFKQPVEVAVDRLNAGAPGFISAARRDPDGLAIRIALARKVKVNTIPAGERYYVDLLPDDWKGLTPGLPQDVIDELARRSREAEKLLNRQRLAAKRVPATVRVKVGAQPTFNRYAFHATGANIVPERTESSLVLNFDQAIKFDLADTKSTLPSTVQSLEAEQDQDSSTVTFRFNGTPEVRTFREDGAFVVDVGNGSATTAPASANDAAPADEAKQKVLAIEAPQTVPALNAPLEPPAKSPPAAVMAQPAPTAPARAAEPQARSTPPMAGAQKAPAKDTEAPKEVAEAPAPVTPPAQAQPAAPAVPPQDLNVTVALHKLGTSIRLDVPFTASTPAAVFRRGDTLWLIFETAANFDVAALRSEEERAFKSVALIRGDDGIAALRIKLEKQRLVSVAPEGPGWAVTIGDSVTDPTQPLQIARSVVGKNRSNIVIPFQGAHAPHRVVDPEVGDTLVVVTAPGPARGFLKPQDFVELKALASAHGVVIQPLADDVSTEIGSDKIVISRPGGLMLSTSGLAERDTGGVVSPVMFDAQTWGFDREAKFTVRQSELIWKAAAAPEGKRRAARLNLARFYMARDMIAEAKAVLDVAIADERGGEDSSAQVLRAAANVMIGRTEEALKELGVPQIGSQGDAPLWRAFALARQGSWAEARETFKNTEASLSTLPLELQRTVMLEAARAAIEVRDFNGAAKVLNDFEVLGVPHDLEPAIALITGRLNEGLGRREEALSAYRIAADSRDRRAAAQGRLRETVARYETGELKRNAAIDELESLTATWRGDETESEGLKLLAHLYTEEGRYRDAFHTMRTALLAHPNSDLTRKIQDEAATSFDSLFLAGKGDGMPPIEALGLFYDYRELTPIGRRGDEMIRKLADRLVSVDLLEQASELLQHQVDHRLQGAARAQVATRLATIYLMNRKPDKALAALRVSAPVGPAQRLTRTAAASGGARPVRCRPSRPGIGDCFGHQGAAGGAAAGRHSVGGKALARGRRADRGALRRTLEGCRSACRR